MADPPTAGDGSTGSGGGDGGKVSDRNYLVARWCPYCSNFINGVGREVGRGRERESTSVKYPNPQ